MALYPGAGGYDARLQALEERLRDLESASSLGVSAIQEGALVVLDEDDVVRARIGQLLDGTYGVQARIVGSEISGSTILVLSGATPVARIDASGLWLRDSSSGSLVLIGSHIFGAKTNLGGADVQGSQAANSVSGWVDLPGSAPTVVSATGRFAVETSANLGFVGTGNAAHLEVRSLLQAVTGGAQYPGIPITIPGGITSMAQQLTMSRVSDIAVPVNTPVLVKHQYNVFSGIATVSDFIVTDYRTAATPA